MGYDKVLNRRPPEIVRKLGERSKICLLNSHDIFKVLRNKNVIVMACNIRIKHVVPGIMKAADELDAVVAFEIAKSEGDVDGGYTGQTPEIFFETIINYAEERRFYKPFFIHGDHIKIKDSTYESINSAKRLIAAELKAGYTSFAIDASFNLLEDNIKITTELARPIVEKGLGLEVEVGEIKSAGQEGNITTVNEALTFISSLVNNGINPDLLAINNGSKHGNYLDNEEINIDLNRTKEIYDAISSYGVSIAQHGITGTPLNIVGKFADYGIRKGNVGTLWQNIAHKGLPEDLVDRMKKWAINNNKDIKFATKEFKEEIDSIGSLYRDRIENMAYEEAKNFIKAFRSVGIASFVIEELSK
jgi:fructose-bisphosphate aldolase class II